VRFAYADPPYLGCCTMYEHYHPDGRCWNEVSTHDLLIKRLNEDFPDGWAMSASSPSLRSLLPLCPPDVRVLPWCKRWHQIRKNVPVQHAWEPVIVRGGREQVNNPMVRDWFIGNATKGTGTKGAKSEEFCFWVFDVLGAKEGDELVDLYPGSGMVGRAWDRYLRQGRLVG
jgi:hypothetical protein